MVVGRHLTVELSYISAHVAAIATLGGLGLLLHFITLGNESGSSLRGFTLHHTVIVVVGHRCSLALHSLHKASHHHHMGFIVHEGECIENESSGKSALHERCAFHHVVAIVGILIHSAA